MSKILKDYKNIIKIQLLHKNQYHEEYQLQLEPQVSNIQKYNILKKLTASACYGYNLKIFKNDEYITWVYVEYLD